MPTLPHDKSIEPNEFHRRMLSLCANCNDPMVIRHMALTIMTETLLSLGYAEGLQVLHATLEKRKFD